MDARYTRSGSGSPATTPVFNSCCPSRVESEIAAPSGKRPRKASALLRNASRSPRASDCDAARTSSPDVMPCISAASSSLIPRTVSKTGQAACRSACGSDRTPAANRIMGASCQPTAAPASSRGKISQATASLNIQLGGSGTNSGEAPSSFSHRERSVRASGLPDQRVGPHSTALSVGNGLPIFGIREDPEGASPRSR